MDAGLRVLAPPARLREVTSPQDRRQVPVLSLARFHYAQTAPHGGYSTALAEIRAGRKRSHWIWFIFPQIAGLGHSSTARAFAVRDLDEARAYLRDPILRARYEEISRVVAGQIERGIPVETLMGGSIAALKLTSSLTLFRAAASQLAAVESGDSFTSLAALCDTLLQHLSRQGYAACQFTLETGAPR